MNRLGRMLAVTQGTAQFPAKVDNRLRGRSSDRLSAGLALLEASIPEGAQTLIFDEPESGLAIPAQGNLFNLLFGAAKDDKFQIIIATHSAFALGLPNAHYIEMSPGYIENSESALQTVHLRLEMMKLVRDIREKQTSERDSDGAQDAPPAPPTTKKPRKPATKNSS